MLKRFSIATSPWQQFWLCHQGSSALTFSRLNISSAVFAANVSTLQKEMTKSERKRELQQEGRNMFERETLEDALSGGLTPILATSIATTAATLRISATKSPVFQQLITWAMQPNVVNSVDSATVGRLLHASLILSDARLFEVLFSYLWRVVELAPTMNGVSCAMIINAYGRSGIRHDVLYEVLCDRATQELTEDNITIAHIANVANALSRVQIKDKKVFDVLLKQALRLHAQATPLVMTTLLDAFATVGIVDEELFALYEAALEKQMNECSAPIMTSVLVGLVRAKRMNSKLFATCASRAAVIAHTYDAASIAKSLDAFYKADNCAEQFFGMMSERACKVVADFRTDEIFLTLRALSAFQLFDQELYPLMASRFISITKVNKTVAPDEVIGILSSFATVQERHDELIHTCSLLIKPYVEVLTNDQFTQLLWAFSELNVRNDTTRHMVSEASSKSRLSTSPPCDAKESLSQWQKKLETIKQVYGVGVSS